MKETKTCTACGTTKPTTDFTIYKTGPNIGRARGGKCKPCYAAHIAMKRNSTNYKPQATMKAIKEIFVELYAQHKTPAEIGKEYNCSSSVVRYHLRKQGVKLLSPEEWLEILWGTKEERLQRQKERERKRTPKEKISRKETKRKAREKCRAYVKDILIKSSCMDCGYSNWLALDFDHREPEKKYKGISDLVSTGRTERLIEEIPKCDVVCANCHRIRTSEMFGSWRMCST